jgi:hypothetical protein
MVCVPECPEGTFRHDVAPRAAAAFAPLEGAEAGDRQTIHEKLTDTGEDGGSYGSYDGPEVDCADAACNGLRSTLLGSGEYCKEGYVCCMRAPGKNNPECLVPPCWSKGETCPLAEPVDSAFLEVQNDDEEVEVEGGAPMAIGECLSSCPASHPYIEVDHCVKECPLGQFADPEEGLCTACDPECGEAGCTAAGPTGCEGACRAKKEGDVCVAECPEGKFAPSGVEDCAACNVCHEGSHVHSDCTRTADIECKECKDHCDKGAYMAGFCDGNGAADAVECLECTAFCPVGFWKDGHCDGKGRDDAVGCVECDGQCGVDGCRGSGPTACVSCKHVRDGARCAPECAVNGTRPLKLETEHGVVCVAACPEGTKMHHGECLSGCPDTHPFDNAGVCADECPKGQVASEELVCVPCDPECSADKGCIGEGPSFCLGCAHVQMGHMCVATCPEDTWRDPADKCEVCAACEPGQLIAAHCEEAADTKCDACKTKCDEGFFMAGECTGADTSDTIECRTCTAECGIGHFLDGHCNGEGVTDDVVCTACSPECEAAAGCNGVGTDLTACNACAFAKDGKNCVLECPEGKPLRSLGECVASCPSPEVEHAGNCVSNCPDTHPFVSDGKCAEDCGDMEFADEESVCAPCNEQCKAGCDGPTEADCVGGCAHAYNEGRCVPECPENKWKDADTACEVCSTCGEGSYVKKACDKDGSDAVCSECTSECGKGQYMKGTCDGSADHNAVECIDCTSECGEGFYLTGKCDGTGMADAVECRACSTCSWGEWVERICSPTADIVCKPCRSTCPKKDYIIDDESRCDGTGKKDTTKCVDDGEEECKEEPCKHQPSGGGGGQGKQQTVVLVSSSVATGDTPEKAKQIALKDAQEKLGVIEKEEIGAKDALLPGSDLAAPPS